MIKAALISLPSIADPGKLQITAINKVLANIGKPLLAKRGSEELGLVTLEAAIEKVSQMRELPKELTEALEEEAAYYIAAATEMAYAPDISLKEIFGSLLEARIKPLIITTGSRSMARKLLNQLGLKQIKIIAAGSDLPAEKQEDLYLLAVKRLNLSTTEVVLIDENKRHARIAGELGLRVIRRERGLNEIALHLIHDLNYERLLLAAPIRAEEMGIEEVVRYCKYLEKEVGTSGGQLLPFAPDKFASAHHLARLFDRDVVGILENHNFLEALLSYVSDGDDEREIVIFSNSEAILNYSEIIQKFRRAKAQVGIVGFLKEETDSRESIVFRQGKLAGFSRVDEGWGLAEVLYLSNKGLLRQALSPYQDYENLSLVDLVRPLLHEKIVIELIDRQSIMTFPLVKTPEYV